MINFLDILATSIGALILFCLTLRFCSYILREHTGVNPMLIPRCILMIGIIIVATVLITAS